MLGLDLCWENGRLRFYDPSTGEYLRSMAEVMDERDAAERRADNERTARQAAENRAEDERAARQAAEAEAQQLREQLQRLQEGQSGTQ
jgi:valyl-tRNA synthetase